MSYRLREDVFVASKGRLARTQRFVLLCLCRYADDSGNRAFPSVSTLAADCGLQPRALINNLRRLRLAGWIDVVQRGGGRGRATHYHVNRSPVPMLPLDAETLHPRAVFPAAGRKEKTVHLETETLHLDARMASVKSPHRTAKATLRRTAAPPIRSRDPVITDQPPPTPASGGSQTRRLRAWERRRMAENAAIEGQTRRWRCHHAGTPCGINAHCFLRTLHEVRAGTVRIEDVPDPVATDVREELAAEQAERAGQGRRQA